jgi:sugar phosphate isomerase/epimerase
LRAIGRREFVIAGAAGLTSLVARPAGTQDLMMIEPVGLQLYTVRELARADLARTLAAVAKMGYKEVEFAGYHGHSGAAVGRMLHDNGLAAPAAHVPLSDLAENLTETLDAAGEAGVACLILPWIDAKDRNAEGYRRIAGILNAAAAKATPRNISVAYHNNVHEFEPIAGGRSGYEILLRECPPENLLLEMDIFWMRIAGQDPVEWFARAPGRYRFVHVKDMGPAPRNEMLDVGRGVIDWGHTLAAAAKTGVKHFFVEHDAPGDALQSAAVSYEYLRKLAI